MQIPPGVEFRQGKAKPVHGCLPESLELGLFTFPSLQSPLTTIIVTLTERAAESARAWLRGRAACVQTQAISSPE